MTGLVLAEKAALSFARSIINEDLAILDTIQCDDGWIFFIDGLLVPKYGASYSFMDCPRIFLYENKNLTLNYIDHSDLPFGNDSNTFFEAIKIYFDEYSKVENVNVQVGKESLNKLYKKLLDAEFKGKSLIGSILFKYLDLKDILLN